MNVEDTYQKLDLAAIAGGMLQPSDIAGGVIVLFGSGGEMVALDVDAAGTVVPLPAEAEPPPNVETGSLAQNPLDAAGAPMAAAPRAAVRAPRCTVITVTHNGVSRQIRHPRGCRP